MEDPRHKVRQKNKLHARSIPYTYEASGAKRSDLPLWSTVPLKLKLLGAEIQEWPTAIPESHLLKLVQLSRKASGAKRSDLQLSLTLLGCGQVSGGS